MKAIHSFRLTAPARGMAMLVGVAALAVAAGVAQMAQAQPLLDQPLQAMAGDAMGPGGPGPLGGGMGGGMGDHMGPMGHMGSMGHGGHMGPMWPRGGMAGMGHGGASMMGGAMRGRMLDLVNATPEQRGKIETIWAAARQDLAKLHDKGQAMRQQSMDLLVQPSIDAKAAETLRQQMLTQHDAASKRMMQAMIDAANVLTPEQRKTLSERMAQRREMMERHRTERQKLMQGDRPAARETNR